MPKIAIIGAGQVGSATAYALLHDSCYDEILLVDNRLDRRDGQVRDLSDAASCENSMTKIRAGTYREASQADVVVIAAGLRRMIGEPTVQSIERSVATLRSVIKAMRPFRPDTVLIVVSNPVDVLTTVAQEVSGLSRSQVIGSGTLLDCVRLRRLLSEQLEVAITSVSAYVLGGHGDSQFVAWSLATINGIPLDKAFPEERVHRAALAEACRREGQRIIETKGAIAYGIGSVVSQLCACILFDERQVWPVSHYQSELGCCLSLPVVLGNQGIIKTVDLPLSEEETGLMRTAGKSVVDTVRGLMEDQ